jgi:glycosyltransferase involved in cell wall biosynthesis
MTKKIGILAFADKNTGGVYQYTESIIDALKNDTSNKYVIFCYENEERFNNLNLEIRVLDKKKTTRYQNVVRDLQLLFNYRRPLFFSNKEKMFFNDIELFLCPMVSSYPHFYLNRAYVFTLHDMQERYYPSFFSKRERLVRWLNNKSLAKNAYKIICESSFVQNDIHKFTRVKVDKINIIQTPPPEDFLKVKFLESSFTSIKKKYNLPTNFIFYPAQCWHHKNHIKLIEAFNIVCQKRKDIFLVLTGSQKNNYINVVNKIEELKIKEKVIHLGYIDYADLPYFYKMSHFLVMPTLFESVSIPIYEAFSLEVPVCSSNVVALPEQVGDAGLIFDPFDINDMAEKMILFLDDKNLRVDKGTKGLNRILNFNHLQFKTKLLKVLN